MHDAALIIAFFLFLVGLVVWIRCLCWVFNPLDQAAKSRRCPYQFNLGDLLSLFVLMQLALGCVKWSLGEYIEECNYSFYETFFVFTIIASIAVWWICVLELSKAGIQSLWRRCVVISAAIPAAFVGSVIVAAMPGIAMVLISEAKIPAGVILLLLEPVVIGLLYFFAWIIRQSVDLAEKDRPASSPFQTEEKNDLWAKAANEIEQRIAKPNDNNSQLPHNDIE
jgi:hypothetical protein